MESFNPWHLKCTIFVLMVFSLVHASWKKTYEQDKKILEKWYLDLHPDVNNIEWPEVKNLLQKTHRKICDEVFQCVQPYFEQYIYVEEYPANPEGPSGRVKGPDLLELDREMLAIPYVECLYNRNTSRGIGLNPPSIIYLTHANSSQVFTLSKDQYSDIFYLQTGLHPVSFA